MREKKKQDGEKKEPRHLPFTPGQRWISEMEPELGLGQVMEMDARIVRIRFGASGCTRQYAIKSAPLKRVRFSCGDRITLNDGTTLTVQSFNEADDLIVYQATVDGANSTPWAQGGLHSICETDLADTLAFTTPKERLNAGLLDPPVLFDLRYEALLSRYRYQKSDVMGFLGARVDLIPHQFYIAGEVASRYLPRVMLADETGLGKTIEACLILNRLLLTDRIHRVLILVPNALVHQWFIELYRRFHLSFRIMDDEHWRSFSTKKREDGGSLVNPFLEDQLFICDLEWMMSGEGEGNEHFDEKRKQTLCIEAGWDMVVVDEAHHVDENTPSYHFLQQLTELSHQKRGGLMLITATPEQLGEARHFAHLKLLDPERYTTLDQYRQEGKQYRKLAAKLDALNALGHQANILDCYGPGRAVFRNTRKVIQGFPKRKGILYPLTELVSPATLSNPVKTVLDVGVTPERIEWLVDLLKRHSNEKFLLICHTSNRTVEIAEALKQRITLKVALFNSRMTLLQRDRSAAWFSEPADKNGAQLMICSEIGSEGRNFQFAHHLILFDLPLNPELLEQRIGRLDRIGQKKDIEIHLPFTQGSAQEVLAKWYDDGTEIFERNISGIHTIYKQFEARLTSLFKAISNRSDGTSAPHRLSDVLRSDSAISSKVTARPVETTSHKETAFDASTLNFLIDETKAFSKSLSEKLFQGKDRLLELNSFRPAVADALIRKIETIDNDVTFDSFILRLFSYFDIQFEDTTPRSYRLHPINPDMCEIPFPAMHKTGMHVTFDRKAAVTRDDITFLTWDHPLVVGGIDLLLGSERGNCSVAEVKNGGKMAILLETVHVLECIAPKGLSMHRFLPPTPIRTVVNHEMKDVTNMFESRPHKGQPNTRSKHESALYSAVEDFDHNYPTRSNRKKTFNENDRINFIPALTLSQSCKASDWLNAFPEIKNELLPELFTASQSFAKKRSETFIEGAKQEVMDTIGGEVARLLALQKKNPAIRADEIEQAKDEVHAYLHHLTTAQLRLDAVRLIKVG